MKYATAIIIVMFFLLLFPATAGIGETVKPQPVYAVKVDDAMTASNIEASTNALRESRGLNKLGTNLTLRQSACAKLFDMVKYQYWAHDNPTTGDDPWVQFKAAGYSYRAAGENLAYGHDDTKELIQDWFESPKHRDNMLNDKWAEQGICTEFVEFTGKTGKMKKVWLTVHHFGNPI